MWLRGGRGDSGVGASGRVCATMVAQLIDVTGKSSTSPCMGYRRPRHETTPLRLDTRCEARFDLRTEVLVSPPFSLCEDRIQRDLLSAYHTFVGENKCLGFLSRD